MRKTSEGKKLLEDLDADVRYDFVDWTRLLQDVVHWKAIANTMTNLRVA
jgi:hypothetical protein